MKYQRVLKEIKKLADFYYCRGWMTTELKDGGYALYDGDDIYVSYPVYMGNRDFQIAVEVDSFSRYEDLGTFDSLGKAFSAIKRDRGTV